MINKLSIIQNYLQDAAETMRKLQVKISPENYAEHQYYKGYLDGIDFAISIVENFRESEIKEVRDGSN